MGLRPVLGSYSAMEETMNVLILHSVDGHEYVRAILYPDTWTPEHADLQAMRAFRIAQDGNDAWTWEDYEPVLIQHGFVIPLWHHGPAWDCTYDTKPNKDVKV